MAGFASDTRWLWEVRVRRVKKVNESLSLTRRAGRGGSHLEAKEDDLRSEWRCSHKQEESPEPLS